MSMTQSRERMERRYLPVALLALAVGLAMVIAGLRVGGTAELPRVALAARSAGMDVPDDPTAAATFRQVPLAAGSWRSGWQRAREFRKPPHRSESPSWGAGDLRVYLLRSAAATHRGNWLGETSTPEFS